MNLQKSTPISLASIYKYLLNQKTKMDLYGKETKGIPQKIILHLNEIFIVMAVLLDIISTRGEWRGKHLNIHNAKDDISRKILIFTFNIVIFLRIGYRMFFPKMLIPFIY